MSGTWWHGAHVGGWIWTSGGGRHTALLWLPRVATARNWIVACSLTVRVRSIEPMRSPISLAAAMRDPELLGGPFMAKSFWPWHCVAKVLSGEALDEREAELFRKCTGRTKLPSGRVRRLILLVGRRGGKDRFESVIAVYEAAVAADWSQVMSARQSAVVLLIGADKKQARILRRYCVGLLALRFWLPRFVVTPTSLSSSPTGRRLRLRPMMRAWCAGVRRLRSWEASAATGGLTTLRRAVTRKLLVQLSRRWR